jgi:hypothetical protein
VGSREGDQIPVISRGFLDGCLAFAAVEGIVRVDHIEGDMCVSFLLFDRLLQRELCARGLDLTSPAHSDGELLWRDRRPCGLVG